MNNFFFLSPNVIILTAKKINNCNIQFKSLQCIKTIVITGLLPQLGGTSIKFISDHFTIMEYELNHEFPNR